MAEVGSWEEATRELDDIVAYLEGPDVNIDDLIVRLQRGAEIVEALEERLVATKAKVEEIAPRVEKDVE
ncbi:MAG: exodeoxyribonuclease VII small subunit [Acidobacteria bacterium]|nr:exodeoxyribonuclease VII small subunit [Acidobacteriota bacterium]